MKRNSPNYHAARLIKLPPRPAPIPSRARAEVAPVLRYEHQKKELRQLRSKKR